MDTGALVISLDFELHWGVRDKRSVAAYRDQLLGVREAIPRILQLFAQYEIHATWATVGFLFCETKDELMANLPERMPLYTQTALSPYLDMAQVGHDERSDPFHFAPSLLEKIAKVRGQEIGTHSLSHYYCLEEGQVPEDLSYDLEIAQNLAREKLGTSLRSIVFPRNQFSAAHLLVAAQQGLQSFRGNQSAWIYQARSEAAESKFRRMIRLMDSYTRLSSPSFIDQPRLVNLGGKTSEQLCNIPASMFLRPFSRKLKVLESMRIERIAEAIKMSAMNKQVFHLWWHPHNFGTNLMQNCRALSSILESYTKMRSQYGMKSLNMYELAEEKFRQKQLNIDSSDHLDQTTVDIDRRMVRAGPDQEVERPTVKHVGVKTKEARIS